jgi:branched-chain amino acid transport system ATP-binding protein
MLALARCYLAAPSVVLLDEVSMGLAPRIVDEIYEVLRRLASGGTAMLLVEQYLDRALELADTVHLLARGRIVFSGAASALDHDSVMRGYLGAELDPAPTETYGASNAFADGRQPRDHSG